jgi:hypothetical protein
VPEPAQRDLRELTRQRRQLIQGKASVANRIQKVLEDANIKLGSVATDESSPASAPPVSRHSRLTLGLLRRES